MKKQRGEKKSMQVPVAVTGRIFLVCTDKKVNQIFIIKREI
jgi:hypothetical protein